MHYEYFNLDKIDSIDTKYWGKHTWIFLNSIALTYNVNNKDEYVKFLNQLQYVLPCNKCRDHFKKNLLTLTDNDLKNKESLLNWLMKVRNTIYVEQKRPIITKEDTIKEIFDNSKDTTNIKNYYIVFLIGFVILVILLYIILYKN